MKVVAASAMIAMGSTESLRGLPADPAPVVFTKSKLAVRKPNGKREVLETMGYDQIQVTQYSSSGSGFRRLPIIFQMGLITRDRELLFRSPLPL